MLLLIVCHAGFQLRSDDPTALKEIILSVKQRADSFTLQVIGAEGVNELSNQNHVTTRVMTMIAAIADLKNNKRRSSDVDVSEKISFYRKILGRIKSLSVSSGISTMCLRMSLSDIRNVETSGRWWSVGSSWIGNQHKQDLSLENAGQWKETAELHPTKEKLIADDHNGQLLALATNNRMNTDVRRAVFCILMGSHDYEDAFMKLLKADLMEKDVVRVLIDCCTREQFFNPFYSLLGARLCEYSSRMKFTFQLAFWDMFNQLQDSSKPKELKKKDLRLSSNLAKLLSHLLKSGFLKLSVLRRLNISLSSMSEPTAVFLTVLFTDLFESISDTSLLELLIKKGFSAPSKNRMNFLQADGEDDGLETDWTTSFKESLNAFFLKYLQSSPKNVKSSTFQRNLKAALRICEHDESS